MSKEPAILPQRLRVSASLSLLGALNAAGAVRFDHQDVRLAVYLALHTMCGDKILHPSLRLRRAHDVSSAGSIKRDESLARRRRRRLSNRTKYCLFTTRQPNNITFDAAPPCLHFEYCCLRERSARHREVSFARKSTTPRRRVNFQSADWRAAVLQTTKFCFFHARWVLVFFSFLLHLDAPLCPNFQRKCAAAAEIVIRWQMLIDFNLKLLSKFYFAEDSTCQMKTRSAAIIIPRGNFALAFN